MSPWCSAADSWSSEVAPFMDRRLHSPLIWAIYSPEAIVASEVDISLSCMNAKQLFESD